MYPNTGSPSKDEMDWDGEEGGPRTRREYAIPDEAYIIADKYRISNRALTELAAVFLSKKYESNIDSEILSTNTTRRRRSEVRTKKAKEIT